MNKKIHMQDFYLKYKICVSGAAETSHCGDEAFAVAEELGKEIIKQGAVLVDGATTGFPFWAAKGAKSEDGIVIGVSPAESKKEHVATYELPVDYHDIVMYTGHGYSGRNLLLTRMADAVIVGCGRMGTLNEFTIAFEDKKPIGVLKGAWETDEVIDIVINKSQRSEEMKHKIVYSEDPKELVKKVIELIEEEEKNGEK
ncbi:MAG: hypothetical protein WC565_02490 [Parcubacteria group bacterium]